MDTIEHPTPTLGQVADAGATTTDTLTVGGLSVAGAGAANAWVGFANASQSYLTGLTVNIGTNPWVVYDQTRGACRLLIDSGGNVGIGTTTPGAALEVKGTIVVSGATNPGFLFEQPGFVSGAGFCIATSSGAYSADAAPGDFIVRADTGQRMIFASEPDAGGARFPARLTVLGSGNVGVGTTSPAARLDVAGTANATAWSVGGAAGWTGTYATGDGRTVTVSHGLVTGVA